MLIVKSVSEAPIRLTAERWDHIERRHPEMKGEEDRVVETIANPDYVQKGDKGELIAIKHYLETPLTEKDCVVVYKEMVDDGFVVTAYFTNRPAVWREILWKR